jgi:hypothetical protein
MMVFEHAESGCWRKSMLYPLLAKEMLNPEDGV